MTEFAAEKSKSSEQFEALKWLHDIARDRYNARRQTEWKIAFGIWTAFGLATGFVAGNNYPIPFWAAWSLIILALGILATKTFLWIPWIQSRHKIDARQSYWWSTAIVNLYGLNYREDLRPGNPPEWPYYSDASESPESYPIGYWECFKHRNAIAQIIVTSLLVFMFVIVVIARVNAPDEKQPFINLELRDPAGLNIVPEKSK